MCTNPYSNGIYDGFAFNTILETRLSTRIYLPNPVSFATSLHKGSKEDNIFLEENKTQHGRSDEALNQSKNAIPITYMLLDSKSTVNVFANPYLLTSIHIDDHSMRIRFNASIVTVTHVGYLK